MKYIYLSCLLVLFTACYNKIQEAPKYNPDKQVASPFEVIDTEGYELILPQGKQKGVLVLFPGFSETPASMKQEFKIV